jgi:hypothetical protein
MEAIIDQAVRQLREAEIDWSQEAEELEDAVAALRNDPASALASLVEPWTLLGNRPGAEVQGGRVWVDPGAAELSEG